MFLLALSLLSCKSDPVDSDTPPAVPSDDTADTEAPPAGDYCGDLGLTVREWQDATSSTDLYALASDITIPTTAGDWTFSEQYSGCDSYLFIQDVPRQDSCGDDELWTKTRDVNAFIEALPTNTHVFFISTQSGEDDRVAAIAEIQENVESVISDMDDDAQAWWREHLHYTTERDRSLPDWLGSSLRSPGWGIGIDRFQRLRYIGSYGDPARYSSSCGWFEENLEMATNEAVYYNYESDRDDAMQAEGATEVEVFKEAYCAGNVYSTVELPDASELATYDTLTVDLYMGCDGEGEYGTCPAWDYMAYLYVCDVAVGDNPYTETACQPYVAAVPGTCTVDGAATKTTCTTDDDCAVTGADTGGDTGAETSHSWSCDGYQAAIAADTQVGTCRTPFGEEEAAYSCNSEGTGYDDLSCGCDTEIGRWITTYHREGRWWHDISGALPLLASGEFTDFRFNTTGPYNVDATLRFSNQEKDARPDEAVWLFAGGTINSTSNDSYAPVQVEIPADATKVELATVITGHGMNSPYNCGEFCDMTHHFTVDGNEGEEIVVDNPWIGDDRGCMKQVDSGTVPNQYGTWWYGRAGWCPGRQVPVELHDITDQVTPGTTATFTYRALYEGETFDSTSTNLMASWLVFSR